VKKRKRIKEYLLPPGFHFTPWFDLKVYVEEKKKKNLYR